MTDWDRHNCHISTALCIALLAKARWSKHWSKKFDIRLHRCHTQIVQSYPPGCANVHPSSRPQSASAPYRCCPLLSCFEYIDYRSCPVPSHVRIWTLVRYAVFWAHPSPHPKRHLDCFGHFCRDCNRDRPYRLTHRWHYCMWNNRLHLPGAMMQPDICWYLSIFWWYFIVVCLLWPPYGIFMVALWNRADHYIFMLWFVLSSSFFFFLA